MPDYAKIAYDAYKNFAQGKSLVTGDTLPEWDALKPEIKAAWDAAVQAVLEKTVSH